MATGTIKKDGLKLLWTNPSPNSDFAAQSVSLDLSSFTAVLVVFEEDSTAPERTNTAVVHIGIGSECACSYVIASGSGFIHVRRLTSAASTGITFQGGQRQTYNTALVTENKWQVPKYIYGIG